MLIGNPIRLPVIPDLLQVAHNNQLYPLNKRKLFLFACHVSGLNSKVKDYQKTLSNISQTPEDPVQTKSMILYGISGSFGVIREKLIHATIL